MEGETTTGLKIHVPKFVKQYKITSLVSSGATCCVFTAIDKKKKETVAIKAISSSHLEELHLKKLVEKEIAIMQEIDHPNIVKFIESFQCDDIIYIVTEYCPNGDLLDYVNRSFNTINPDYLQGILSALSYLHKRGISHGDIKLENVVIDKNNVPKLIDFGFVKTTLVADENSKNGSLMCAAPELFKNGKFNPTKADIWSFGILIFALATHRFPYQEGSNNDIVKQILTGKVAIPAEVTGNLRTMITKCTNIDPEKRPSADELLKENIFRNLNYRK